MRVKNLADLYHLPLVEWSAVTTRLDANVSQAPGTGGPNRHTYWLATINPDGSPHVNGIGGLWAQDAFWFQTGDGTRKARNLARDPRCTASVATEEFDVVLEGTASLVTDEDTVSWFAQWCQNDGWPAHPDASGIALTAQYSAPSAGPPPWHVYKMTLRSAMALSVTGDGGATKFDF
jgi:PPOX class probable F420-dependent enzyme